MYSRIYVLGIILKAKNRFRIYVLKDNLKILSENHYGLTFLTDKFEKIKKEVILGLYLVFLIQGEMEINKNVGVGKLKPYFLLK